MRAKKPENVRRGERLRTERRVRHWDKPEMASRLATELSGGRPDLHSLISYVKRWESGLIGLSERYLLAYLAAFGMTSEQELFAEAPAQSESPVGLAPVADGPLAAEALDLATWLESSNVGLGTVTYLASATRRLGHDYPRRPPVDVLADAVELQKRVTALLRGGRQRLAQTRVLLETSAELFALIALLAGDIGRFGHADSYGHAGLTCANEADSNFARTMVLCAQSKTARQEEDYARAASLARQGLELCPTGPERILLAVCEAVALKSLGDLDAARLAMQNAQQIRESIDDRAETSTAWTCPRPRQQAYAIQVGLGAADAVATLHAVREADARWTDGDPWVYGTWAQVRIGAALAHIMSGEIEGAASELDKVFELGTEYRVTTITMRMGAISRQLQRPRWEGHPVASDLRERIHEFHTGSLVNAITGPETP